MPMVAEVPEQYWRNALAWNHEDVEGHMSGQEARLLANPCILYGDVQRPQFAEHAIKIRHPLKLGLEGMVVLSMNISKDCGHRIRSDWRKPHLECPSDIEI
jgi:hypothetical protein